MLLAFWRGMLGEALWLCVSKQVVKKLSSCPSPIRREPTRSQFAWYTSKLFDRPLWDIRVLRIVACAHQNYPRLSVPFVIFGSVK